MARHRQVAPNLHTEPRSAGRPRRPPHRAPRARRRRGFSLVEVLIASAILAGGAGVIYGWISQQAGFGVELGDREDSTRLAQTLLDRYRGLPLGALVTLVPEGEEVDPDLLGDPGLLALGPAAPPLKRRTRSLRVVRLPGPVPAAAVDGSVGYDALRGPQTVRTRALALPVPSLPADLKTASGFRVQAEVPEWGRAQRWGLSEASAPKPGQPESLFAKLVRHRAGGRDQDYAPADFEDSETPTFTGDEEATRRAVQPDGPLGARHGLEEHQHVSRHRHATARFHARNEIRGDDPGDVEVPDGEYLYTLDALDLREADPPRILGVYHLRGALGRFRVVASASAKDDVPSRVAGDRVVARETLRDTEGTPWRLTRTEARLFLIETRPTFLERRLVVAALPSPDASPEGITVTRERVAQLKTDYALEPGEAPDELVAAAERYRPH